MDPLIMNRMIFFKKIQGVDTFRRSIPFLAFFFIRSNSNTFLVAELELGAEWPS